KSQGPWVVMSRPISSHAASPALITVARKSARQALACSGVSKRETLTKPPRKWRRKRNRASGQPGNSRRLRSLSARGSSPASPRSRTIRATGGGVSTSASGAGGRLQAAHASTRIHHQRTARAPLPRNPRRRAAFSTGENSVAGCSAGRRSASARDMREARDLAQLRVEAEDIARRAGQPLTTAHALLAIFTVACPARTLLLERGVDEMRVLAAIRAAPDEPAELLEDLYARAHEIAAGLGVEADTLHLLIAISRSPETLAHALLVACAVPLSSLRNTILSWYTSG